VMEIRLSAERALAETLYRQGDFRGARRELLRCLEAGPGDAALYYRLGTATMRIDHQQLSLAAEAERWFRQATERDPGHAQAHFHLGIVLCVQTRREEATPHFRRAVQLQPTMAKAHFELALSLIEDGQIDDARASLGRVLELEPSHPSARQELGQLPRSPASSALAAPSSRGRRFPTPIDRLKDLPKAIRSYVLGQDYPVVLRADSKVATFGSCFAANVARALREAGVDARNTTLGEHINSTFANRSYVDWILGEADAAVGRVVQGFLAADPSFPADREAHQQRVRDSGVLVLTVGVAPAFFSRATGQFVLLGGTTSDLRAALASCEFRMTTVGENRDNLGHVIRQLRRLNERAVIMLTLSPVPLNTTFDDRSAVVADCLSKSTLRVAIDEVLRARPAGVYYWPSFEVIRWLGAYVGPMFGAEDQSTFHVSEAAIADQVDAFIEKLSGGALSRRSPGQAATTTA
jgi:tetratricopeptide (TPR) repeat protein